LIVPTARRRFLARLSFARGGCVARLGLPRWRLLAHFGFAPLLGMCALGAILMSAPSHAAAGAWTTPEGVIWTKVSVFHLRADRIFINNALDGQFCANAGGRTLHAGDRGPLDCMLSPRPTFISTQLFVEAAFGIWDRLDLRVQIPFVLRTEFQTTATPQSRSGLGDLRFSSQLRLLDDPMVLAVRVGVKAPTGQFTPDAVGVPLGEGNWDLEGNLVASRSIGSGAVWLGAEVGYRIRLEDRASPAVDVGDEILAVAEGGYRPIDWLYLPLRWDMQWGFQSSTPLGNLPARRVMNLQTGVMVQPFARTDLYIKDLGVEFGVRIPLWGRGWPADPVYFVGISSSLRVFEAYSQGDEEG